VLVLRAGVGAGSPLTRTRVARRLDITVKRVARLERAGLRRLRGLCTGASGAAGGASGELVSGEGGAAIVSGGEDGGGSAAGAGGSGDGSAGAAGGGYSGASGGGSSGSGGGSSGSGGGSSGGSGSGNDGSAGGSRGGVEGVSATHPPSGGSINLTIPLVLVALALAAWALTGVLRGRGGAPAVAGPEPEAPKPWRPRLRSTMQGPGWTERPSAGTGDAASWSPGSPPAAGAGSAAAAQGGGDAGSEDAPPPDAAQPARDESWAARPQQPSRR
jgi:hypothetical protein